MDELESSELKIRLETLENSWREINEQDSQIPDERSENVTAEETYFQLKKRILDLFEPNTSN